MVIYRFDAGTEGSVMGVLKAASPVLLKPVFPLNEILMGNGQDEYETLPVIMSRGLYGIAMMVEEPPIEECIM